MINPSGGGRINLSATIDDGPRYAPSRSKINELRRDRQTRWMMRDLYSGRWAKVLIDTGLTQHHFPNIAKGSPEHVHRIDPLIQKFNVFKLACLVHADVNAGVPPLISVDEDLYPRQKQAMKSIGDRCLIENLYLRANQRAAVEASAVVHACIDADILSPTQGAVLTLGDNDEWLPVGPVGPDGQPRVWERRWLVTRRVGGKDQMFVRVERYWSPNRAVLVENEAYRVDSADTIVDLSDRDRCKRVPLTQAIGSEAASRVPEIRQLNTPYVPVISLFRFMNQDDKPEGLIGKDDIDLLDEVLGAFSQWSRGRSLHATPKLRVGEMHVDEKTGQVDLRLEAFTDREKVIEYIEIKFELDKLLQSLDRTISYALAQMQMSTMLLGLDPAGGQAETSDSRRYKAMSTLSAASRTVPVQGPAMSRICTVACALESSADMGWAYGEVTFTPRPEIPRDKLDRVREQSEMLASGVTSVKRAVEAIHGEDVAPEVLEEIAEDEKRRNEQQRSALFGATSSLDPYGDRRAETPPQESDDVETDAESEDTIVTGSVVENV